MTAFPTTNHVFVYGTLKKGFPNYFRLKGRVRSVEKDTVAGYTLYSSGMIPFAVPDKDQFIKGEVMEIIPSELSGVVQDLDRLEAEGSLYHRVEVTTNKGRRCFMYVSREKFGKHLGSSFGNHYNLYWEEEEEEEEEELCCE